MGWWERGLNDIFVSGDGVSSGLDTFGLGGGWYKKNPGGSLDMKKCTFATI